MTVNGNKQFNGRFSISTLQKPNSKGYQIYFGMLLSGAARWDVNPNGAGLKTEKKRQAIQKTLEKQSTASISAPRVSRTGLTPKRV